MVDQTSDPGSIGAGQLDPTTSNSDFDVVMFIASQLIAQLEIMVPVQVVTVHPGTGSPPSAPTVDVQLLVSLLDGANNATQSGIVYGIPVWRLQGGKWTVIIDPTENDFGYIISASRDISSVKDNPGIQNPGSLRKHSFSDAIYMGGCFNAVSEATWYLKGDGTLQVSDSKGNVVTTSSAGWNFKGPVTFQNGVTMDSTLEVTGDATIDGIDFATHVHGGVQTGGGDTGPPV